MTKHHLKDIPHTIQQVEDKFQVIYEIGNFSGYCEYVLYETKGVNKPIKQRVWLMTTSDMGDIIEYLHKKSPLSSEDFSNINMLIREDSLEKLNLQMGNQNK